MQMGVHCLTFVLVFIAKTHIGNLSPFPGKSLAIAILHRIKAILLDILKQTNGIFQSLGITRGTMIFAQTIDGKADSIDLFLCIQWVTFIIERPVNAAELPVIEMIYHIAFGTHCRRQVFFFLQQTVGCRESPQDAAAKDCTPPGVGYQFARSGHAAEKSSSRVNHLPRPEREDIIAELFGELALELLFAVHVHLFAALRRASFSPISLMRVSLSG